MSLTNALQAARTGLFAAQAGIDLVSRNIANASTEGYTRKVQPQSNLVLGNQGAGVSLDAIVRLVDKGLQRTFFDQISTTERLDVIGTSLEKLESLFGKPSDQDSIAGLIGRFREAVSTLSTSPDSQTAQTQAVQAARDLATELNHLSTEIQSLRAQADLAIDQGLDSVSSALTNIATLNDEIAFNKSAGNNVADLEDQRDTLVRQIATQMDIRTFERPDGTMAVLTGSSRVLLDVSPSTLSFTPTPQYTAAVAGQAVNLTEGPTTTDIRSEITGGRLAGYIELRDSFLPQAQDQLDAIAFALADAFDTVAVPTTPATTATVNLFTTDGTTVPGAFAVGLAENIQVRTAVITTPSILRDGSGGTFTAGGPADQSLPLGLLNLFTATQAFNAGGSTATTGIGTTARTFASYAADIISFQANQAASNENTLRFNEQLKDSLETRFGGESGVNVDEELAALIQLESAYTASARVITTIQQALDDLLGILR